MPRRMPVKEPVRLMYVGPARMMFHNAYTGPVSGNGYYAEPGQIIEVERVDVEAMTATPHWKRPPATRRAKAETQPPPATGREEDQEVTE